MQRHEVFKKIPDFPNYLINERGEIRNNTTGNPVKPSRSNPGAVSLNRDGKSYMRSTRKLVTQIFTKDKTRRRTDGIRKTSS